MDYKYEKKNIKKKSIENKFMDNYNWIVFDCCV